jgi:hypothetical protein
MTPTPRKSVSGAGSEPVEDQAIHDHRVTFQKAGWFHFAWCNCGYIDCGPVEELSLRAANHDLRQVS